MGNRNFLREKNPVFIAECGYLKKKPSAIDYMQILDMGYTLDF